MKKRSLMIVALVLSLSVLAAGNALARWDGANDGRGQRGFNCRGADGAADVDLEKVVKFKKETLPLRDQLWTKKLELSREYKKEKPDPEVVEKLRAEMAEIQTSIDKVAADNGLADWGGKQCARGGFSRGSTDCPRGRY